MTMKVYYTALDVFDEHYVAEGLSWQKYLEWSRLSHLTELISLDRMLNNALVKPDYSSAEDWKYIVSDGSIATNFFSSLGYVLRTMKPKEKFNLLAVSIEPLQDGKEVHLKDFEFVGYELLDKEYGNSVLTNCGGFDETFLPSELNRFGLIDDYEKAFDVKRRLLANNPKLHHADTHVIAVWRHTSIGRAKK